MARPRSFANLDTPRQELPKLFDKTPPHALEAEIGLLGSMILDWQICGEVLQILSGPDDFYKAEHAAIYQLLIELYDQNDPIDLVRIKQRLQDLGQLEEIGGVDYLVQLCEAAFPAHAVYHAKLVCEKAILRRLIDAAGKILFDAYTMTEPVAQLLDNAEQQIFQLAESRVVQDASDLKTLLQETYERLEAQEGRHITGCETGFFELDELTNGLQPGEMIIVAARPSMGKTSLALNMAEHIAAANKQPVAIFSLEMSKQQLAQRLLCSRSGVDSHKLRRNMLSGDDFATLSMCVGELSEAPIYIDDTPGLTILGLRAKARRIAARHDIKALFIDYLQLMSAPGTDSRQSEVAQMSRSIKALARELNVPVVCLSQLNRSPEAREGHRPRMSDLRESGSIEQDSDVILMLHREEYFHNDPDWREQNPDKVGVAELIITKQRNGPTGTIKLQFHAATTRFHNLATTPTATTASDRASAAQPAPF